MRLSVDLDPDTHRRLRIHAANEGTTMSEIVRNLLAVALVDYEALLMAAERPSNPPGPTAKESDPS